MKNKIIAIGILLTIVALSAGLIAGCGSKAADPQQGLDQAVQSAKDAGSVKAEINVNLSPQEGTSGSPVSIQGESNLDMNAKVLEGTFTPMGVDVQLRYVNAETYAKFGSTWYQITGDIVPGLGKDSVGAVVNLLAAYPDLFSGATLNAIGDMKVGNYDCTNYDVTPDYAALSANASLKRLADQLGMNADDLEGTLTRAGFEMQVAIQKSEPVIREVTFSANADMPQGGKIAGISLLPAKAHIDATIDFPDYGMAVQVSAPEGAKPFTGINDLIKGFTGK